MTPSTAGGSAQREYERRRVARESRIREKFGRAAGLVLAMTDEPASTKAWATGAAGERKTARRLDAIAQLGGVVLHDRGIAGSRSNIDHLVIISSGVVVIDSKMYSGRIEVRRNSLKVKGRDRTRLLVGLQRQVDMVSGHIHGLPVTGALCFVGGDFAWIRSETCCGFQVSTPRRLSKQLALRHDPRLNSDCLRVGSDLARAFPPAA